MLVIVFVCRWSVNALRSVTGTRRLLMSRRRYCTSYQLSSSFSSHWLLLHHIPYFIFTLFIMAGRENDPTSPRSPKSPQSKHQRASLTGLFEGIDINRESEPSYQGKGKDKVMDMEIENPRRRQRASETSTSSSLHGSLSQRWPPFFHDFDVDISMLGNKAMRNS
jgi:hypothetical protein